MDELRNKAKSLFDNNEIDIFIGYEAGTRNPRPFFSKSADDCNKLIFNEKCSGNLAVYLTRKDIVEGKKVGISASYYALKSIIQLFDENQLSDETLKVFGIISDNQLKSFSTISEIKEYLTTITPPSKVDDKEPLAQLESMTSQERWEFWTDELSKCFKCYACRAACPMCYCTKCIVEVNRPQWISPWASTLSNMEWQINRVMHMAGRCSDCGTCGSVCPVGIPLHILTHKMAETVIKNFGENSDEKGNVLSTFKPGDKEAFIL